jgi:hypothetical protein
MVTRSGLFRTVFGVILAAGGSAIAQPYSYSFEAPTYTGSTSGTVITGVDGWYLPPVASSTDGKVYVYTGNAPGAVTNAGGASQFMGAIGGDNLLARAQHDVNFSGGGTWTMDYDILVKWMGATLPAVDNIGSVSLQDSTTTRYFQALASWGSTAVGPAPNATLYTATADKWHHAVGYFTAALPGSITFATPSPAFRDLLVNNWYHISLKWNFDTSQILQASIRDITGGGSTITVDVTANGWYMAGGPTSALPLPTAVRLFGGGAGVGPTNLAAYDNFKVAKFCYPDCNGDGVLGLADFGCFQTKFALGDPYADCNGDGILGLADFGCFQTKFALGCP